MIIKIRARFNIFICINFFIFKIINSLTANNRLHYLRTRLNYIKKIFNNLSKIKKKINECFIKLIYYLRIDLDEL